MSMVGVVMLIQVRIVVVMLGRVVMFAGVVVLVRTVLVRMMLDHGRVQRVVVMMVVELVDRQYSPQIVLADHSALHLPSPQIKAVPW